MSRAETSPQAPSPSSCLLASTPKAGKMVAAQVESPATLLGKRGTAGYKAPVLRSASRYRGVTHHMKTSRFESHVWDLGKQIYLGGFSDETTAALAYDLAAVKFRGEDAITNHPREVLQQEFLSTEEVTKDSVVQALRSCSKAMNRVDAGATEAVHFEPWELLLSEAVQQDKWQHLGVYSSEGDAARAVDRAVVERKGLEAATNFSLVDYLSLLSAEQVSEGVERGLLPATLPLNYAAPAPPRPLLQLQTLRPVLVTRAHGSSSGTDASGGAAPINCLAPAAAALPPKAPVARKQSTTPRSVMDFDAMVQQEMQEALKRGVSNTDEALPPSKLARHGDATGPPLEEQPDDAAFASWLLSVMSP